MTRPGDGAAGSYRVPASAAARAIREQRAAGRADAAQTSTCEPMITVRSRGSPK